MSDEVLSSLRSEIAVLREETQATRRALVELREVAERVADRARRADAELVDAIGQLVVTHGPVVEALAANQLAGRRAKDAITAIAGSVYVHVSIGVSIVLVVAGLVAQVLGWDPTPVLLRDVGAMAPRP